MTQGARRSSRRRAIIVLAPCVANLAACLAFLIARPPATETMRERDRERLADARSEGTVFHLRSDVEPYLFLAEKRLHKWDEYHGGEEAWAKVIGVLDGPALLTTKRLSDWLSVRSQSTRLSFTTESWLLALVFALLSTVQWAIVGWLASMVPWSRPTSEAAVDPSGPRSTAAEGA